MEKTPGGFLVDWESSVAFSDMTVAEFKKTKPTTPTLFRLIAEPAEYPNLDFPSAATHQAYKLHTRNKQESLYGYVERQSLIHEKFMAALVEQKQIYCVVRLKYPNTSTNDNQAEITHFLQVGWVLREEDYAMPKGPDPSDTMLGQ
jgi:hypothetical protein